MGFTASHSDFSAFEGKISSYGNAAAEWIGERVNAVTTLFSFAKEEVGNSLEAFLHIGHKSTHATPHNITHGEHAHKADHSFEHDNNERTNIMIALRKYLASVFAFNASRPSSMRGRRVGKPEVGHEWAGHDVSLVSSLGAGQRHLTHGDGS